LPAETAAARKDGGGFFVQPANVAPRSKAGVRYACPGKVVTGITEVIRQAGAPCWTKVQHDGTSGLVKVGQQWQARANPPGILASSIKRKF